MKPIIRSCLTAFFAFLAGGIAVYTSLTFKPEWLLTSRLDSAGHNEVAVRESERWTPFDDMRKLHAQLQKEMAPIEDGFFHDPFDQILGAKIEGAPIREISRREDGDYVYFDIQVADPQRTSIDTRVADGYIEVSGKQELKSKEGNSIIQSNFHRTFPLPANVNAARMQTTAEDGKIILKFPKVKSDA